MIERAVRFEPVDILTSAFAGALVLAGLVRYGAVADHGVLVRLGVVALVPFAIAALRARKPRPGSSLDLVCDFYVVAAVVVIFDSSGLSSARSIPTTRTPGSSRSTGRSSASSRRWRSRVSRLPSSPTS